MVLIHAASVEVSGFSIETICPMEGIDIRARNVTLCDNDITNTGGGNGVTLQGQGSKAVIHDCRIHNCIGWGVETRDEAESFIHDNSISNNGLGGAFFNEAGGTLSNNNIFENGPFGVKVWGGGEIQVVTVTIDDNQIGNHYDAGVYVEVGTVNILGNTIFGFMEIGDGIEVTNTGVAHVVGNTISNCGQNGVYLNTPDSTPASHIVGNNIWFNGFGIAGGMGCPFGIISSNIIIQNGQDITYVAPT